MIRRTIGKYKDSYIPQFVEINSTQYNTYSTSCGTCSNAYDLIDESSFTLLNFPNQASFTFRFLGRKAKISAFALETPNNPNSNCYWAYPTSFKFYGTNNFKSWDVIFEDENSNVFEKRGVLNWVNLGKTVKYNAYHFESSAKDAGGFLGISRFEVEGSFSDLLKANTLNLITGFSISLVRKCSELCKLSYKKLNAFKNYNVIAYSEDNSRYHPNWYLVEDSNKDYFLTIRGSASADDWATDFEFDEITRVFSGQSINFHSGFYKAASNVFRKVKPYINKSPKRFYITGHSYGASVSAILCTLAKLDADVSSMVDGAICFAPAPSMSYCSDQAYKYIASIVNDDDIVPTLSIQNGYFLVKPMLKVGTPTVLAVASIIRGATDLFKQISLTQYGKDFYSNLGQSVDKIAEKVIQFHETPKNFKVRYVSGTTYHLKNGKKTLNECIVSQSTIFNSVSITLTSIVRHDMSGYDSKLDKLNY